MPKFVKGAPSPNPSGRPKGSLDRVKIKPLEKVAALGYDPIEYLVYIARCEEVNKKGWAVFNGRDRTTAACEIANYCFAKMKSVEISASQDSEDKFQYSVNFERKKNIDANPLNAIDNIQRNTDS